MHKRAFTRAAGVSPPWLGKRTCQYASAKSRESVNGAITNPGAVAVANPRGLTRPALGGPAVRTFAGETATCAIHERSFTRAATVSPPWIGSRTGNGDRFLWSDYVHQARSDGTPRLAYVSRSWCRSWWRHANRRKCAVALCTGDSFHNHGWLTPAALGARRRSAEK